MLCENVDLTFLQMWRRVRCLQRFIGWRYEGSVLYWPRQNLTDTRYSTESSLLCRFTWNERRSTRAKMIKVNQQEHEREHGSEPAGPLMELRELKGRRSWNHGPVARVATLHNFLSRRRDVKSVCDRFHWSLCLTVVGGSPGQLEPSLTASERTSKEFSISSHFCDGCETHSSTGMCLISRFNLRHDGYPPWVLSRHKYGCLLLFSFVLSHVKHAGQTLIGYRWLRGQSCRFYLAFAVVDFI